MLVAGAHLYSLLLRLPWHRSLPRLIVAPAADLVPLQVSEADCARVAEPERQLVHARTQVRRHQRLAGCIPAPAAHAAAAAQQTRVPLAGRDVGDLFWVQVWP